ncbi:toxin-antitoxin system YwqK family antitoxin [Turicibacter sanguinis]|uniref:toxin-antitoxin system YwqK family antitoxin n=1 Tax=Turicibacter sanguinis TaxID=154288 RepID=UPI002331321E|nr:hypothetical protein [Turicibacter sanguinis]MDB8458884.1 hypothetical protein [Turicibacter sanguinis]
MYHEENLVFELECDQSEWEIRREEVIRQYCSENEEGFCIIYCDYKKIEEGKFENGKLVEGIWYGENGKKWEEGKFENGKLVEGIWYRENGKKWQEGKFKNGELVEGIEYDTNEKKWKEGKFENGKLVEGTEYHENGEKREEGEFKKEKLVEGTSNINIKKVFIIAIIAIIGIFMWGVLSGQEFSESDAWAAAQVRVKRDLKAPSSAKFPMISSANITKINSNEYSVRSYVDAENSFGAKIRTNFTCRVVQKSSNTLDTTCNYY